MHELLSPAGDINCLYQAIHNGADAVYLGLKEFGARKFSKNFTNEEIVEAIKLSHLYGVKVYVTMNTLVKDSEVDEFLNQVEFLYKNRVDAILMQDFGMINLVRRMYPKLEIHASTQANSSSIDTIRMFYNMGVKRVVLSREVTLDEINSIDVPIDLEVFIHGALCISYSGNCLMSSMIGNRSGNRGECAGSCRLKYDLLKDGKIIKKDKYLLSTKELNTSIRFNELLKSKIKSFKIEGRMKSPEYVGFITSFYRKLIDQKEFNLDEEINRLKTLYNRDFTTGNLFNDKNIMNINTPNHIGLEIGKVIDISKDKIKIKLKRELNQEDGIRFLESGKGLIVNFLYNDKHKLISSAKKGDIVYVDNKIDLSSKDTVSKTLDKKLNTELSKYKEKKIDIDIHVIAHKNEKLKVTFSDKVNTISSFGNIVEESINAPISKDVIKRQILKLGNTPFICNNIKIDMDKDIFINIKDLNSIRRKASELLIEKRKGTPIDIEKHNISFNKLKEYENDYLTCSVITEEQLITCLKLDFKRIYVNDLNLYNKYKSNDKVYFFLDRNKFNIKDNLEKRTLVSEYFEFNNSCIGNYSLNIENIYSTYYLLDRLNSIPISVELNKDEINNLYNSFVNKFKMSPPLEILVYGRVENMIIKGNILNIEENKVYDLVDKKKRVFKAYCKNNLTHILNYEVSCNNYNFNFPYIKRFDFYEESGKEIIEIIDKLK